jgi:aminoglycoside phosphotransferase (APT) family kinase protein
VTGTPAAEIEIDAAGIRELLFNQHPDLASLPIFLAASGWDNMMFRLGDDLCVRLPRRAAAASRILTEQRWLPELAPILPLPIPSPVRTGRPSGKYPWSWNVIPWMTGTPADLSELNVDQGLRLSEFLRALHRPAPMEAPRNPVRGCPLAERAKAMEARIERVREKTSLFTETISSILEEALAAPIDVEATWIHGDLHAQNILVEGGHFSAVIDWGDVAQGDRATDLAAIWMLLSDVEHRRRAIDAYGLSSKNTWARARGWAILFGLVLLDTGMVDDPRFAAMGESTLRRVAEGP